MFSRNVLKFLTKREAILDIAKQFLLVYIDHIYSMKQNSVAPKTIIKSVKAFHNYLDFVTMHIETII